jgi:hypothetical protein
LLLYLIKIRNFFFKDNIEFTIRNKGLILKDIKKEISDWINVSENDIAKIKIISILAELLLKIKGILINE